MTFNEADVRRDRGGQFTDKTGAAPEVDLSLDPLEERVHVPLKNPFEKGGKVTVPAGTRIIETDSFGGLKGTSVAGRKRTATIITSSPSFYAHTKGKQPPFFHNRIDLRRGYVEWFGPSHINRVYITEELLESNGLPVEHDQDQLDKFARDIESGHFEIDGIQK